MTTQTLTTEPTPDTTPAAAPAPQRTAKDAARELVAQRHHVHLVSDGATRCVSRHCTGHPTLDGIS